MLDVSLAGILRRVYKIKKHGQKALNSRSGKRKLYRTYRHDGRNLISNWETKA